MCGMTEISMRRVQRAAERLQDAISDAKRREDRPSDVYDRMLKANARQRDYRRKQRLLQLAQAERARSHAQAADDAAFTRSLATNRYLWPKPRHKSILVISWDAHCGLFQCHSSGTNTAAQRETAALSVLCSRGHRESDLLFARAGSGNLKMSLAIQAAKVREADEEGAWKRNSIAHMEPYNSVGEAVKRRSSLCNINKTFVLSGPPSGPVRFITLAPSAVASAQVVGLDHALRQDPRVAAYFARWGPEIWRGIHSNREYRALLTQQGFGAIEGMSWVDAQERTSPDRWRFIGPHCV